MSSSKEKLKFSNSKPLTINVELQTYKLRTFYAVGIAAVCEGLESLWRGKTEAIEVSSRTDLTE